MSFKSFEQVVEELNRSNFRHVNDTSEGYSIAQEQCYYIMDLLIKERQEKLRAKMDILIYKRNEVLCSLFFGFFNYKEKELAEIDTALDEIELQLYTYNAHKSYEDIFTKK